MIQGIKNCIQWFPIIYRDRQWDHMYLFDILHKKMSLMEDFFRTKASFVGKEKEARKIKICVLLIDRLRKDGYDKMAFKDHEKKFGELDFFDRGKHKKEWNRSFQKACDHEDYLRHQDLDFLFTLIKKHVLSWWD